MVEHVQGDVVSHQRLHLQLVSDVQRRVDAAPAGHRQANKTAPSSKLQAWAGVSAGDTATDGRSSHPRILQRITTVAEEMFGEDHARRPQLSSTS